MLYAEPVPGRLRRPPATRLSGPEAMVFLLVVLALITAWLAEVVPVELGSITVGPDGRLVLEPFKPPLYYAAHGIAIGSVMAAGLLAGVLGGFRILSNSARAALVLLFLTAEVWAVIAYSPEEFFSPAILGATGPFVWITLVFVLAGTGRNIWRYLDPAIRGLSYLTAAMALRALATGGFGVYNGFSRYILYAELLVWLGGWTLFSAARFRGPRLLVRALPLFMAAVMAVCGQSRSWLILACLMFLGFVWARNRELGSGIRTTIIACVVALAAASLLYLVKPQIFQNSATGLSERLDQDTRSGQYRAFFYVVPVSDLLLGRGPKGTWYWPGSGEYQFFDNGYLWMLFIGGVPVFLLYVVIVIWPAFRAARRNLTLPDTASVYLVLTWGLALTGLSTFCLPSIGLSNFLLSLWAGRCHLLVAENRARKSAAYGREPRRNAFADPTAEVVQISASFQNDPAVIGDSA